MTNTIVANQLPSALNMIHPKNFDVPSNTFKVTQSVDEFQFEKPSRLLVRKRSIENSITFKQQVKRVKKSKALRMIMKAIESESSSSCNDQAQSDCDGSNEETRVNVLNEIEYELLKKHGQTKSFKYFHQISSQECIS